MQSQLTCSSNNSVSSCSSQPITWLHNGVTTFVIIAVTLSCCDIMCESIPGSPPLFLNFLLGWGERMRLTFVVFVHVLSIVQLHAWAHWLCNYMICLCSIKCSLHHLHDKLFQAPSSPYCKWQKAGHILSYDVTTKLRWESLLSSSI